MPNYYYFFVVKGYVLLCGPFFSMDAHRIAKYDHART